MSLENIIDLDERRRVSERQDQFEYDIPNSRELLSRIEGLEETVNHHEKTLSENNFVWFGGHKIKENFEDIFWSERLLEISSERRNYENLRYLLGRVSDKWDVHEGNSIPAGGENPGARFKKVKIVTFFEWFVVLASIMTALYCAIFGNVAFSIPFFLLAVYQSLALKAEG